MATPQQPQQQLVPHTIGDLYLKSIAESTKTIKNIAVVFLILTILRAFWNIAEFVVNHMH
jgi:hypothetical protein